MLKNYTTLLLLSLLCIHQAMAQSSTTTTSSFSVQAGADKVICPGGSVTLNPVISGGTTPYFISWSPFGGLSNHVVADPVARPTQTTDYILTVTDSTGLTLKDTVRVTLDSNIYRPIINVVEGTNPFCEGSSVALMASPGASFQWTTGSINSFVILSASDTVSVRAVRSDGCIGWSLPFVATMNPRPAPPQISFTGDPSVCYGSLLLTASHPDAVSLDWNTGESGTAITVWSAGTYAVTATDATGCTSLPAEQVVTGPPEGYIISSGSQTFCAGDSVQISVTTDPSNSIFWSNGSTDVSQWVSSTGDYSAMLTSPEGCAAEAENLVTVTVLQPPAPPMITANGPLGFCLGGSVMLYAQHQETGLHFIWNTGNDLDSISVQSPGAYTVRAINDIGCASIPDTAMVTVFPKPTGLIVAAGNTDFCAGDSVELYIQSADAVLYNWSDGNTALHNSVKTAGQYSATLVSSFGCTGQTSNSITASVRPLPQAGIMQNGNQLEVQTDADSIQWFQNGQAVGNGSAFYSMTIGGPYSVMVTKNGCSAQASVLAILRRNSVLNWQAYPNPVINDLHIVYTLAEKGRAGLSLRDATGRTILVIADGEQSAGEHSYTVSSLHSRLSKGVYFIVLSAGGREEVQQLLIR